MSCDNVYGNCETYTPAPYWHGEVPDVGYYEHTVASGKGWEIISNADGEIAICDEGGYDPPCIPDVQELQNMIKGLIRAAQGLGWNIDSCQCECKHES